MVNKKAALFIEDKKYIYTVKGKEDRIKIIVYQAEKKTSYFTAYFSYVAAWGFDVYSPRTIEILIRCYSQNSDMFGKNEFGIREYPFVFQALLDNYFADSSNRERDEFVQRCMEWEF